MATFEFPGRRLIIATGFAVAVAVAPAIAVLTTPAPSEQELTACSGRDQGECLEETLYGPGTVPVPNVSTEVQQSP